MVSKKYVRPVLVIGATAFLICVIALAAASHYLNSDALRRTLVQRLNADMVGTLAVGRHQISLLRGTATLWDVTLQGGDGRQLATLDRLQAGLFWPALVKREIRLTRLDLEMQTLALAYDSQDRLPLVQALSFAQRASRPRTESAAWTVSIDAFSVSLGQVALHRPARQWQGRLDRVAITGGGRLMAPAGRVSATVGRVVWQQSASRDISIDQLTLAAAYAPSQASPIRFDLTTPGAAISLQGGIDWQARVPNLDLVYRLDLDAALAQALLAPGQELAGRAKANGNLQGPWDDPGGTLHLEIDGGRLGELTFQLGLDAALRQRKLTISAAEGAGSWGEADLSGTIDLQPMFARTWRKATAGLDSPVYDLKLNARQLQPHRWPGVNIPFRQGSFQLSVQVAGKGFGGSGISGNAGMTLETKALQVATDAAPANAQLSAQVTWAGQMINIVRCTAASGQNSVNARGHIDLAARRMDLHGDLDLERLQHLGAQLTLPMPEGRASISLHGRGDLTAPAIQASVLARDLAWGDWTIGKLLADTTLSPEGALEISRLVLENQGSLVQGQGRVKLLDADRSLAPDPDLALTLDIEQLEINDFYVYEPLAGQFNGKLTLGGSLKQPAADLDLTQSPLRWQGLPFQARGRARWQNRGLTIPELHLTREESALELQGDLSWLHPESGQRLSDPLVTAQLQSRTLRLEDLRPGWNGNLSLGAQVAGTLSDLQGAYHITGDSLAIAGQPLHALRCRGRLRDRRLDIDRLAASVAPGQDIEARGWYDFDGRYEVEVKGGGIDLNNIPALQQAYPVAGLLNLNLIGSGSVARPDISAALNVAGPRFRDQTLQDFHIDLRLHENQLDLDADLNFALQAGARLDSGTFDLRAVFNETDLSPYLALGAGPSWSGHLSGVLQAAGNWHSPMKTLLNSELTNLQLSYQSIPLVSADALTIELQEGVVKIPASRLRIMQDGYLALAVSGTLQKDLDLTAEGRLPLAALAPFTSTLLSAEGDIEIQLLARGVWPKIPWQVDLTFSDIGMTIPELAQTISDVNGHVLLTSQALTVEELTGQVDSGSFSLNGRVRLKEMTPVQGRLRLSARSLPLQWPGTMDLVVHGDLNLQGQSEGAVLSGRLDLVEGTYYKDLRINLLSAVTRPRRRRPTPAIDRSPAWMEAIDLDVAVGYRNPLLVDNNLANLRIAPNLRLKGTLARPLINGRAEVTDGELIYRRKTFAVERGLVDFINPYDNEPTLDILSKAQIRNWQVSLAVTGTPDALRLKLSSDPPEADNDILSLILLGRTNKELMQGNGQASQTTTQMLATLLATAWGEDVRKSTGVDILELETGAQNEKDSQDRTQVTVGKKLSRRLTIKYAVESNQGDMIQKAISEYRFLEHLLVSGFQDSRGDYGGELLFRIEFQ